MNEAPINFIAEMDLLAAEIAKAAREAATNLGDKVDAFKALMPYYTHNKKLKLVDPEDDKLPNFDNFTSNIHATEIDDGSNESGVRGSRRNGN